ncbi:MAG: hypothetical protein E5X23_11550 [Mesorhizobium sp.]|nr:hypothetical protein EJ078_24140 [Mesorhizobium sp. M1A.F.Ca.IN.022.06.1.1]RUV64754.1 hypothetical protein EOA64_04595 [Mesorhizobium sp. M1A.F.Ca.IN.022.02.1.1]RUV79011.1 hypothetical protein EOA50_03895 [Mesorhizobium sp. M1A.F.Ca.IN.020.30.1.1]RWG23814.1 MAG: hypothetical protein EOQ53_02510 [Mesorhizobium sp.]TGQ21611.1 hypothetical protein EN860_006085 [Mesorhizobium sp. M00.F.Ca.ET.217.01.1.1]TGV92939.1 hypothetical protein EN801_007375 [Mesorhizobium sp. M00.F.Ca.ET.158.01.1.1]
MPRREARAPRASHVGPRVVTMSFDYIIVGAGSGCVLANRLTEDPDRTVLLIEAGDEPDCRLAHIPGAAFMDAELQVRLGLFHHAPA